MRDEYDIPEMPEPDPKEEIKRFLALAKAKCEADFFAFARICFPHICRVEFAKFQHEIVESILGAEPKRHGNYYFAYAAPRGFAKSTFSSILLPLWLLLSRRRKFFVLISEAADQSENFISTIKHELETNEMIQALWGDVRGDVWQADRLTTSWSAIVVSKGITSKFRGLNYMGQRPDFVVCDDLESDESVLSPVQTRKVMDLVKSVVMGLSKNMIVMVIGTILHYESVLAQLMDKNKNRNWVSRIFRATENGDSIWPEHMDLGALNQARIDMGPAAYSKEMMNDPIGDGVTPFRWEWIRFDRQPPLNIRGLVQACDLSTGEGADFFVHVTVALDTENNFHILEMVRGKYQMDEQVGVISANSARRWRGHSPDCVVIETNAYQVVLAQHLRGLLPIPISRENHNRAKVNRIMSLEPWFANAKIYVPENAPWVEDFRTEYVRWRQIENIQDDQLDAVQMAVKKLSTLYGATSIEPPKAGKENAQLIVTLN